MKKLFVFLVFSVNAAGAQVSDHKFSAGLVFNSLGYDYSNIHAQVNTLKSFKNAKPGFMLGYTYEHRIVAALYLTAGLYFKTLPNEIFRPQYFNNNFSIGGLKEKLNISRFEIPLSVKVVIPCSPAGKVSFYAGPSVILIERMKREVTYSVPFPAGDSVRNITVKQSSGFGSNSSIGAAVFIGAGYQFKMLKTAFAFDVLYSGDLSKRKMITIPGAEDNSYFFTKSKTVELRLSYLFK